MGMACLCMVVYFGIHYTPPFRIDDKGIVNKAG